MNPNYEAIKQTFAVGESFISHRLATNQFLEKLTRGEIFPAEILEKFNNAEKRMFQEQASQSRLELAEIVG